MRSDGSAGADDRLARVTSSSAIVRCRWSQDKSLTVPTLVKSDLPMIWFSGRWRIEGPVSSITVEHVED